MAGTGFNQSVADEVLIHFFHAKDQIRHAFSDGNPEALEHPHAFTFVFDLWIKLSHPALTNGTSQIIHRQQVIFPS